MQCTGRCGAVWCGVTLCVVSVYVWAKLHSAVTALARAMNTKTFADYEAAMVEKRQGAGDVL